MTNKLIESQNLVSAMGLKAINKREGKKMLTKKRWVDLSNEEKQQAGEKIKDAFKYLFEHKDEINDKYAGEKRQERVRLELYKRELVAKEALRQGVPMNKLFDIQPVKKPKIKRPEPHLKTRVDGHYKEY